MLFVSGFFTSGDLGPSPPPSLRSQGAGPVGEDQEVAKESPRIGAPADPEEVDDLNEEPGPPFARPADSLHQLGQPGLHLPIVSGHHERRDARPSKRTVPAERRACRFEHVRRRSVIAGTEPPDEGVHAVVGSIASERAKHRSDPDVPRPPA